MQHCWHRSEYAMCFRHSIVQNFSFCLKRCLKRLVSEFYEEGSHLYLSWLTFHQFSQKEGKNLVVSTTNLLSGQKKSLRWLSNYGRPATLPEKVNIFVTRNSFWAIFKKIILKLDKALPTHVQMRGEGGGSHPTFKINTQWQGTISETEGRTTPAITSTNELVSKTAAKRTTASFVKSAEKAAIGDQKTVSETVSQNPESPLVKTSCCWHSCCQTCFESKGWQIDCDQTGGDNSVLWTVTDGTRSSVKRSNWSPVSWLGRTFCVVNIQLILKIDKQHLFQSKILVARNQHLFVVRVWEVSAQIKFVSAENRLTLLTSPGRLHAW